MSKDTIDFFRELKGSRPSLTIQQYKTIKGQAVKGNIADTVDGRPYEKIVEIARNYIRSVGGFEKFAEWGLV